MRVLEAVICIIMEKPSQGITFERIHFEGTKNVVDAAVRNGVRRYVHMSALGVRPDAISAYHRTKYLAEQYVRASGLDWTIVRPSGLFEAPSVSAYGVAIDYIGHRFTARIDLADCLLRQGPQLAVHSHAMSSTAHGRPEPAGIWDAADRPSSWDVR